MKAAQLVGAWAAGNLVLTLILLAFTAGPLQLGVHLAAVAILTGFGLIVGLAARAGRVGPQQRQPRSASAAVLAGLGVAMGLTGVAYGWWLSVLGLYPLALAAWLLRGERLPPGARPWPVALDGAEPSGPAHLTHHGSSPGAAIAVPVEHAAHAPPAAPPGSVAAARRPDRLARAVVLLILVAAARAVRTVLRGRRE